MPTTPAAQQSMHTRVLDQLAYSGLLEDCGPVMWLPGRRSGTRAEAVCSGRLNVEGHTFWLRIRLPWEFPLCLPVVAVERMEPRVALPHFIRDKELCFTSDENLLDRWEPEAILHESLVRVRDMLRDMLVGDRGQEFLREAVAYWVGIAGGRCIDCTVTAGESPRVVSAFYEGAELLAVTDDAATHARSLPQRTTVNLRPRNAIYLPLDPGAGNPSFLLEELTTPEGLRKYAQRLPEGAREVLRGLLRRCDPNEHLVVLGLKRSAGERALVGVLLKRLEHGHPLRQDRSGAEVEPIALMRRDRDYLLPRGGAEPGLQERRVLIAGCGAVGGYIALALARAGVGELSLVDPDSFTPENTYRHVCGMHWLGQPKVTGLKLEIEGSIPYVEVKATRERLETLLHEKPDEVRAHDLVIAALGQPTIELHLNEWTWSDAAHPPALFTWLEPFGLGGHALLTHVPGQHERGRGCLECVYARPVEGSAPENRAAFAAPSATYTRDVLGCGSRFLPFADLDAQRTAELAARLALRALRLEADEAPLLSWKGDSRPFLRAGYTVTPRYLREQGQLEASRLDYRRRDCPICGPD
jgi:molybdopterin/thiamine biosynthesis adenylyltransferase